MTYYFKCPVSDVCYVGLHPICINFKKHLNEMFLSHLNVKKIKGFTHY